MIHLWLFFLVTITTLFQTEATVEWISRPRSRLFVNAGETAEIKWKFPPGTRLILYKKKTLVGGEIMIASKQGSAKPQMFNATTSIIRIEKSGALSVLKAGLKDEGLYEIAIAYDNGIILKDEVEIKIQEAPVITTFPRQTKGEVFYTGMTINLLCMAKGRPVPKVQWLKNDDVQPLQKSSGSILHQIKSASKKDSGNYRCVATNQAGKATRSIQYIILQRPYDIDFVHNTALDGTIYEGESVTFTCYAKGNPPISYYKLFHNGKEINRSASGKYIINEVKLKHNGTYCCIPINRASIGENRTVVLKVKARPTYWKEKLRRTTLSPTDEEVSRKTTSGGQSTVQYGSSDKTTLVTPTKSRLGRNSAKTVNLNIDVLFLLSLIFSLTEITR